MECFISFNKFLIVLNTSAFDSQFFNKDVLNVPRTKINIPPLHLNVSKLNKSYTISQNKTSQTKERLQYGIKYFFSRGDPSSSSSSSPSSSSSEKLNNKKNGFSNTFEFLALSKKGKNGHLTN